MSTKRNRPDESISRREMVKAAGIGAVSVGLSGVSVPLLGRVRSSPSLDGARAGSLQDRLFPLRD